MGEIIDSEKIRQEWEKDRKLTPRRVANPGFETFEPDDVIEFDDVKYEDPEYKVETIEVRSHPAVRIEEMLNNGWHLYRDIVCPPYVILFFSREKESGE